MPPLKIQKLNPSWNSCLSDLLIERGKPPFPTRNSFYLVVSVQLECCCFGRSAFLLNLAVVALTSRVRQQLSHDVSCCVWSSQTFDVLSHQAQTLLVVKEPVNLECECGQVVASDGNALFEQMI